jgi:hypothetical protein
MHPDLINNFVSFLHDYNILIVFFSFLGIYWYTRMNCYGLPNRGCLQWLFLLLLDTVLDKRLSKRGTEAYFFWLSIMIRELILDLKFLYFGRKFAEILVGLIFFSISAYSPYTAKYSRRILRLR